MFYFAGHIIDEKEVIHVTRESVLERSDVVYTVYDFRNGLQVKVWHHATMSAPMYDEPARS